MSFLSSFSSEELIALFKTLSYVFMGVAVLGFALAVFFFFYFDIPIVRAMMTGKARRDTIRKMEEENFKTGKLRYQYPGHTGDTRHSGRIGKTGRTAAKKHVGNHIQEHMPVIEPPQTYETGVLHMDASETAVLHGTELQEAMPCRDSGETAPLKTVRQECNKPAQPQVDTRIRFRITENTVVIHTTELI